MPTGILPFTGVADLIVVFFAVIIISPSFTQYLLNFRVSSILTAFNSLLDEIVKNDFYLGFGRYCSFSLVNPCTLGNVTRNIFRGYQINAKELDQISIENEEEDSEYRIINISDIRAEGFVSRELKAVRVWMLFITLSPCWLSRKAFR